MAAAAQQAQPLESRWERRSSGRRPASPSHLHHAAHGRLAGVVPQIDLAHAQPAPAGQAGGMPRRSALSTKVVDSALPLPPLPLPLRAGLRWAVPAAQAAVSVT